MRPRRNCWPPTRSTPASRCSSRSPREQGLPGRRYYGGRERVDRIENLARDRAAALFGAEFANIQPHSGAQANAAVLAALMKPGERLLGLDLAFGGHLIHGMKLNFSGMVYDSGYYGVDAATGRIDMQTVRATARAFRPRVLVAGWSAYPRTLDFAAFRSMPDEVGAHLWVDMAHFADRLLATDAATAGVRVVTGGTDVHLVLVDLRRSSLDGRAAEDLLGEIGITVNRNAVPDDPRPPMVTSGLRTGTSALATRGFGDIDFIEVADIIATALARGQAADAASLLRVRRLADEFPLYEGLEDWGLHR